MTTTNPISPAPVGAADDEIAPRRRRRRLTSRQRLTVGLVAGLTVLFAVVGVITVAVAGRALQDRIDRDLVAVAVNTATTLELIPPADYPALALRPAVADETYRFVLIGPDGTATNLGQRQNANERAPVDVRPADAVKLRSQSGTPFTIDNDAAAGRLRVVSAAMDNGYVVVAARSLDELRDSLTVIERVLLVVLLVALCLLVWFVGRQTLKPLEDVIATTDSIDYDNLGERVTPTSNARDVEHLAHAVNGMLTRIDASAAGKDEADRRLRQFVADASHELRTPLAAVLGYTELYQTGVATVPTRSTKQCDASPSKATACSDSSRTSPRLPASTGAASNSHRRSTSTTSSPSYRRSTSNRPAAHVHH